MALIVITIDRTKLPPHTDADFKAWVQFQVNEKRNILEDNPLYLCDMEATVGDIKEHEELVKLAVELRELLFDDANDMMQGAMVGCPVECVAFAKWWIQRAKGIPFDDPLDACAFRGSNAKDEP